RRVIAVAPNDAHRRLHPLDFPDVIEHLSAMTGNTGGIAEAFRSDDRIGTAVAETHHRGAAVELRQGAQIRQRVGEVAFAGLDPFEARLRTFPGTFVVA